MSAQRAELVAHVLRLSGTGPQEGKHPDLWHLCFFSAETAVNIGYSCKMLTDDMTEVFIVTGHTVLEVREELR